MGALDLSDLPKPFRIAMVVVLGIFLVAGGAVGAYTGGAAKASEIANTVAESKDAVIKKEIEDHKAEDARQRDALDKRLSRMEDKLDRIFERGR